MCGTDDVRCSASHALPDHPMPEQSCHEGVACFSSTKCASVSELCWTAGAGDDCGEPAGGEGGAVGAAHSLQGHPGAFFGFKIRQSSVLFLLLFLCNVHVMAWLGFFKAVSSWLHTRHLCPSLWCQRGASQQLVPVVGSHKCCLVLHHSGAQTLSMCMCVPCRAYEACQSCSLVSAWRAGRAGLGGERQVWRERGGCRATWGARGRICCEWCWRAA